MISLYYSMTRWHDSCRICRFSAGNHHGYVCTAFIMVVKPSAMWDVDSSPKSPLPLQREEAYWLGHRHLLADGRGAACRSVGECAAHHTQLCKYYKTKSYYLTHLTDSKQIHWLWLSVLPGPDNMFLCLIDRWGRRSSHWPSVTSAESCCSRVSAVRPVVTSSTSAAALRFLSCVSTMTS